VISDARLGWTIGWNEGPWDQHERGSIGCGLEIYADVNNLFNTANFTSNSGVLTSA
jgi:hypothetical protein